MHVVNQASGVYVRVEKYKYHYIPLAHLDQDGAAAQHCKSVKAWFCHDSRNGIDTPGRCCTNLRYNQNNNLIIYIEPKALFGRKGEVEVGKGRL